MSVHLRSHLAAGLAAVVVSAVTLAPAAMPTRDTSPDEVTRSVNLASSVRPILLEPLRPEQVAVARDAIERLDPEAAALIPAPPADPVTLNAASDGINAAYQWLQGWVNYGVELTQYVLQFVPYGYLIGDQVGIVYYDLVVPIADSVVYDLIDPVVNDPLNIWSYVNGIGAVAATTVASFINLGIAELNYFFGWLIPPIPPIPFATTTTTTATTEMVEMSLTTAAEAPAESLEPIDAPTEAPTDPAVTTEPDTDTDTTTEPDVRTTTDVDTETDIEPAVEDEPTTTTSGTVQAQGEVRGSVTAPAEPTSPPDTDDTTGDTTTDADDEAAEQPAGPDAAAPDAPDANDAED